MQHVMGIW